MTQIRNPPPETKLVAEVLTVDMDAPLTAVDRLRALAGGSRDIAFEPSDADEILEKLEALAAILSAPNLEIGDTPAPAELSVGKRPETRIAEVEFELKAATAQLEIANGEIERLSASKWRTIDSAPTDGTKVLLWFRTCKEPSTGWYDYDYDYADRPEGWPSPDNGWRNDGDHCIPANQADCTHWMPLQAPPTGPASFSKAQTPPPAEREAGE